MQDYSYPIVEWHPSGQFVTFITENKGELLFHNYNIETEEQKAVIAIQFLREERNRLLSTTDWWAGSDLTMTNVQISYRQALRDITSTYTSLEDVVWPTRPE